MLIVPFSELSIMKNFKSHKLGKCVFKNSCNQHPHSAKINIVSIIFDLSPYVVLLECFKASSVIISFSPIKVELIIERGKCNTWSLR